MWPVVGDLANRVVGVVDRGGGLGGGVGASDAAFLGSPGNAGVVVGVVVQG